MTGSASDTLSGRHDTWKNSSYHVPEVLKSTDDGSPDGGVSVPSASRGSL